MNSIHPSNLTVKNKAIGEEKFDAIFLNIPRYGGLCETPEQYCTKMTNIIGLFDKKLKQDGLFFIRTSDSQFGAKAYKVDVEQIGRMRQDIHAGHSTPRFFKNKYEEDTIGVAGERQFGIEFNMPVDMEARKSGDLGIDFEYDGKKIDVKTARKAYNLLVKNHEITRCADILVLAKYNDDKSVDLLGWATSDEMRECPKKDFGYGIVNYYKSAYHLRPISELKDLLNIKHKPFEWMNIPELLLNCLEKTDWGINRIQEEDNKHIFVLSKNKEFKPELNESDVTWIDKCLRNIPSDAVVFDPLRLLKL